MLILAFDTTSEHGGAALFRDEECLSLAANEGQSNYSVTLFQHVNRLLAESGLGLGDVDLLAVANGPGSFTGIRVGLAAAQGWATALSKPALAVSVFEAMLEIAQPQTPLAAAILDARRGEFYAGLFRRSDGTRTSNAPAWAAEAEGRVLKPPEIEPYLSHDAARFGELTCLVREHDRAALALQTALPGALQWKTVRGLLLPAIARLALRSYRLGKVQAPAQLDAFYIRRTDAELNWRE